MGSRLHRGFFGFLSLVAPATQGRLLRKYFDLWHLRPDPWRHAVDPYEHHKYSATLDLIPERRFRRILDVGCSEGTFTLLTARTHPRAEVIGIDISERAVNRARMRARTLGSPARFKHLDILSQTPEGSFDLVFCAEILYYLGRRERLRLAQERLAALVEPRGLLVLVHPWPDALHLHQHFDDDPRLRRVSAHVDDRWGRTFAVTVYERNAA